MTNEKTIFYRKLVLCVAMTFVFTSLFNIGGYGFTSKAMAAQITGSGTNNYIPIFTGSSQIGNSVIFSTGGNVGIGTAGTNPGAALHINNANAYLLFSNAGTNRIQIKTDATENSIQLVDGRNLYLTNAAGNGHLVTFQNDGNVGIGTTGPLGPLDVKIATNQHWVIRGAGGTYPQLVSLNDANTEYTPAVIDASPLILNNYSGGSVGIGTTNPGAALGIKGTDRVVAIQGTGTGANALLRFKETDTQNAFSIGYNKPSTDSFIIYDDRNSAYRMRIANEGGVSFGTYAGNNDAPANGMIISGSVGIGTTDPGAKLEVNGAIKLTPMASNPTILSNGMIWMMQ